MNDPELNWIGIFKTQGSLEKVDAFLPAPFMKPISLNAGRSGASTDAMAGIPQKDGRSVSCFQSVARLAHRPERKLMVPLLQQCWQLL